MCGIYGLVDPTRTRPPSELHSLAVTGATCLSHRGPDDAGAWVDPAGTVALGHRRLSILDLSPAGHQPMTSRSGRYVVVLNGEIYNHHPLRTELEDLGTRFRGGSDTEVLVEAVDRWGLVDALRRCTGMFGLGVWDNHRRVLALARDRLGEKPLYYGRAGASLVFGSELKAVRSHPDFSDEVDRDALCLYFRYGYVPAPHSIHKGLHKLLPGHVVEIGEDAVAGKPVPYWSIAEIVEASARSDTEAVDELDRLLRCSVQRQMVADVPVGAFLSGGIDSSLVTAMMQAESPGRVQSFSIGFHESAFDEAPAARAVAAHLGTDHHELYVSPHEAMGVLPDLPAIYDEPFADSSEIPTVLLSRFARENITVALSGDGGDELFGGYGRYLTNHQIWARLNRAPRTRRLVASVARSLHDRGGPPHAYAPSSLRGSSASDTLVKIADVLGMTDECKLYEYQMSQWQRPQALVLGSSGQPPDRFSYGSGEQRALERIMRRDQSTYLPDDILTKVDRASMSVGLEVRVPMLDHHIVELAASVPLHCKVRGQEGKWLLRRVLDRYVPRPLVERPKQGFEVPVGAWIRGPLRPWAEDLLSERRLRDDGFLDPGPVRSSWQRHLSGYADDTACLWSVLMFNAWLDERSAALRMPRSPA